MLQSASWSAAANKAGSHSQAAQGLWTGTMKEHCEALMASPVVWAKQHGPQQAGARGNRGAYCNNNHNMINLIFVDSFRVKR